MSRIQSFCPKMKHLKHGTNTLTTDIVILKILASELVTLVL